MPISKLCNFCAILALIVFDLAIASAEDWTEFRGPRGDGRALATGFPQQWSEDEHVGWKVDLPGVGWASPVVAKNRIYLADAIVTAAKGDLPQKTILAAHCLAADTGKILWTKELFEQIPGPPAEHHGSNSDASSTPVLEGDRLYVHFGNQGTACLTTVGELVWTNREQNYLPQHGNGGSPVVFEDLLIF